MLGGFPYGGRGVNAFPPLGSAMPSCLAAFVGLMAALAVGTLAMAYAACLPCAFAGIAGLVLPLACCTPCVAASRCRCCASRAVKGQLPAGRWPCRVWLAQLAAAPLGAAAEAWQPLVPVAYDCLGDSGVKS